MKSPEGCIYKTKGFTLVELLMVVAVLGLLIMVSLPPAINFYKSRQFEVAQSGIVQTLRRAQLKAMSLEADSSFGVYITPSQYVLFKGSSYTTRDSAFDEVFDLSDNLSVTGLSEIVFSKLRGIPSDTGNISLTIDSLKAAININEVGRINY